TCCRSAKDGGKLSTALRRTIATPTRAQSEEVRRRRNRSLKCETPLSSQSLNQTLSTVDEPAVAVIHSSVGAFLAQIHRGAQCEFKSIRRRYSRGWRQDQFLRKTRTRIPIPPPSIPTEPPTSREYRRLIDLNSHCAPL